METATYNLRELEKKLKSISDRYFRNLNSNISNNSGIEGLIKKCKDLDKSGKALLDKSIKAANDFFKEHNIDDKKIEDRIMKVIQIHYKSLFNTLK